MIPRALAEKSTGEKELMDLDKERFYRARILQRRQLTEDLWSIRIERNPEFRFVAGQYATLGVLAPHKHIERPYSIVSSPYEPDLEFFLELVPRGELTPALHALRVGDEITIRKAAKGRFTLAPDGATHQNHLLLCTVTGVAPFVSYIRTLATEVRQGKAPDDRKLFVLEGASHSSEFGYIDELKRIAAEVSWLKYVPTVSRPWGDPGWSGEVGRVDDLIREYANVWGLRPATTSVYACGHPQMIENATGILSRAGWQKDSVKSEVYFVPKEHVAVTT